MDPAAAPLPRLSAEAASAVSIERSTGEERLDVLDGFRCLAVLMVAVFHYTVRWAAPDGVSPGWPAGHLPQGAMFDPVAPLHYFGAIGVELFFCISGFVILLTLERCVSVLDFAARRAARLWPPMLVVAAAAVILIRLYGPADWRQGLAGWLASVLFLTPKMAGALFHAKGVDWVDGSYWSLAVEVRFYVLAAVLFLVARRRFAQVLAVIALVGSALVVAAALRGKAHDFGLGLIGGLGEEALFPRYILYFAFGALGYERFMRRAGGIDLALTALLGLDLAVQSLFDLQSAMQTPLGSVIACLTVLGLFAAFVFRAPGVGAFAWRPATLLGRASYSFYLAHQRLGVMLLGALTAAGAPILLAVPLVIAFFAGVSLLLFRWVELPAKAWMHRHTRAAVGLVDLRAPWTRYRTAGEAG